MAGGQIHKEEAPSVPAKGELFSGSLQYCTTYCSLPVYLVGRQLEYLGQLSPPGKFSLLLACHNSDVSQELLNTKY